jgi:hypothetical protein
MTIWSREKFPTLDIDLATHNVENWPGRNRKLTGTSNHWKSKNKKPFCWTPSKAFYFGGKRFIALYPCIAFETSNFGHVIQKTSDGLTSGRE